MQLVTVRTNTNFNLDYEEKRLKPEIELIILVSKPEYCVNAKKGQIEKNVGIFENRVKMGPEELSKLIGELQALQGAVANFQNMAAAFNTIITNSEPKKPE